MVMVVRFRRQAVVMMLLLLVRRRLLRMVMQRLRGLKRLRGRNDGDVARVRVRAGTRARARR